MQNYEREGECMKDLCQFCGWEVSKPEWYNKNYDEKGGYVCDNCLMDSARQREREGVK
jgi:hypothetical protein